MPNPEPDRRALLIFNRKARRGAAGPEEAANLLGRWRINCIVKRPDNANGIVQAIRDHAAEVDLVIIGGGDGTMNCAAQALIESGKPLGVLPLGTANDLARTLGIPINLAAACEVIGAGTTRRVDLGRVNGHYFFNVASIGLSVLITRQLTRELKQRWGVLAYPLALRSAIRSLRPFKAQVHCDGRHTELRTIQVAVGNGRHYGGGMTIADDAAIDDHRLDLYSIEPQSLWRLIRLLPALRRGTAEHWDGVRLMQGRHIEIVTRRKLPVNTDGELTAYTPALFDIVPSALPVYVPAAPSAAAQPGLRHAVP